MKNGHALRITLLLAPFLVLSCQKLQEPEWYPEEFCDGSFTENRLPLPPLATYDINQDGIDDIEIFQMAHEVSTASEDSKISTFMNPLNANEMFIRSRSGIVDSGFVMHKYAPGFIWNDAQFILMDVGGCRGLYLESWKMNHRFSASGFHGIIIKNKGNSQIAWFKLDINTRSGEVKLTDSDFSNDSSIVVGAH